MTDSIKTKIAALLAKAEGTDNQFEAEAFMAKVNELLEKHQIDMHEIRAKMGANADPLGKGAGETNLYASMAWSKDVAVALARYYGCRTVWWKRGNHMNYEVFGRESARITFELMLPFVISQVKQQGRRLWLEHGVKSQSVWSREVGQALVIRIWALIPKAEERRADLGKNALVPVDDVQALVDATYSNLKSARAKTMKYTSAAREAAEKVSINQQATGRHVKMIK